MKWTFADRRTEELEVSKHQIQRSLKNMGYRSRLGKINKEHSKLLRGLSIEEALEECDKTDSGLNYPEGHIQLYEIGKYYPFPSEDPLEDFYTKFDIYKEAESEFHIMQKHHLKMVIDDYHATILKYYKDLLDEGDEARSDAIKRKVFEWDVEKLSQIKPYYLDEERTDGEIVRSWTMEYNIFNITHIYRTFNWEEDYLIWSAW